MVAAAPPAISFFVSGTPQTQGSKTARHTWGPMVNGRPTCRTWVTEDRGPRLREWRDLLATAAARAMRHNPPFTGPVYVSLRFFFARPASHTKAQRLCPYVYAKGRDDGDKLARAVFDSLTMAAVVLDDGQIASWAGDKRYCDEDERPGVRIEVSAL